MRPPACTKSCRQIKDDIRLRLPIFFAPPSFLRFGPVFSHNLLNICCKVGESYTVYCVHCHWNFKIMLLSYSQTLFWRRKKPFFVINHFTIFFLNPFFWFYYIIYTAPQTTLWGGPGPIFEHGPGGPEAETLPLDHLTSL